MCYQANAWHYSIKFGCCLDWESLQFRLIPFAVCFWEAENLYNLRCPQSLMGSHDLYLGLLYLHCTSAVKQVDCILIAAHGAFSKYREIQRAIQSIPKSYKIGVEMCCERVSEVTLCPSLMGSWSPLHLRFSRYLSQTATELIQFSPVLQFLCSQLFAYVCHRLPLSST